MFTKHELKEEQVKILAGLSDLAVDESIFEQERLIFNKTKVAMEKGGNFESHLIDLRNALLPLVVEQKLSEKSLVFYKVL
jgi:hypothetical protein